MTAKEPTSRFDCPNCGARYKLLRIEVESVEADPPIACRSCGGPLEGRDGRAILKYFLIDRPRAAGRPKLVDRAGEDRPGLDDARGERLKREAQS